MKAIFTKILLIFICVSTIVTAAHTQTFTRVSEISNRPLGSTPTNLLTIGTITYFAANDGIHGNELWKTDGTASGTVMVKDIYPGEASTSIFYMINFNGTLFFGAVDPVYGQELWKSDGTEAGTVVVKDIYPGTNTGFLGGSDGIPVVIGNNLYFRGLEPINGFELWKTDGTESGTTVVKDINPGNPSATPSNFVNINGILFFSAFTPTAGRELFKTDGTALGTELVKDINSGSTSSTPLSLININNKLFFFAIDGTNGLVPSLYISDGTSSGTQLVKSFSSSGVVVTPTVGSIKEVNGLAIFQANDGTNGNELWQSDGTTAGTSLVKDICIGISSSNIALNNGIKFKNNFYFSAYDSIHGIEVWKTDGTNVGTIMLKDIFIGDNPSTPNAFFVFNDTLLFTADDGLNGVEIWKTDGTEVGTRLFKDISLGEGSSYANFFALNNNKLLFRATDEQNGYELWQSDGINTNILSDIRTSANEIINSNLYNGSSPYYCATNDGLYFTGFDFKKGGEAYYTTGTANSVKLLKDIYAGAYTSIPNNYTKAGSNIFFTASDGKNGTELWRIDSATGNVNLMKDINPGYNSSSPTNLIAINNILFFTAYDGVNYGLWKSDGTTEGTILIKIFATTTMYHFTNFNGLLIFAAFDPVSNGYSLFKSDGTSSGTTLLKGFTSPAGVMNPSTTYGFSLSLYAPIVINNLMYFTASDGTLGYELWKTDGTTAGTVLYKDLYVGSNSTRPYNITHLNGSLFFLTTANSPAGGELWRCDLSTGVTSSINSSLNISNLTAGPNNLLFFSATESTYGTEMWTYNKTNGAYGPLRDIYVGNIGSYPSSITKIGNYVYFYAKNFTAPNDYNLYRTDGTYNNTVLVRTFTGNTAAYPIITSGNNIYTIAGDGSNGFQLFSTVAPLPLQLLNFSATKNTNNITCKWQTTNELNTSYFNLQRSIDGINFTTTGTITAEGTTNAEHTYTYNDVSAYLLAAKKLFYRLKSVDRDGSFTYSNVVVIELNNNTSSFSLAPNPAKSYTVLTGKNIKTIQVIDNNGKVHINQLVNQLNSIYIDISKLPKGSYIVKATDEMGTSTIEKLIIN